MIYQPGYLSVFRTLQRTWLSHHLAFYQIKHPTCEISNTFKYSALQNWRKLKKLLSPINHFKHACYIFALVKQKVHYKNSWRENYLYIATFCKLNGGIKVWHAQHVVHKDSLHSSVTPLIQIISICTFQVVQSISASLRLQSLDLEPFF